MKRIIAILISILPYLYVFVANIFMPLDADLGWHLKYGEYFWQNGVPLFTNPYSTMMPDYRWPNSSWFTDVISYSVFNVGGFVALSLFAAAVVTATFYFFAKAFKLNILEQLLFFPVLSYLLEPINGVSFRGQQLSLLFLGILLWLLETSSEKIPKLKCRRAYLIPILFFVWVNTHGEFLLGFGIFGVWVTGRIVSQALTDVKSIKEKITTFIKSVKFWAIIFIASCIVSLVNPFGIKLYQEALVHIGNADLKYVVEYLPFPDLSSDWRNMMFTFALLVFGISIYFFNGKWRDKLPSLFVAFTLFFLALSVKRFAWPFYYTTPAVLASYFTFTNPNNKWTKIISIIIICLSFTLLFYYRNPVKILQNQNWDRYCTAFIECSEPSARFLEKTNIKGMLWTNYNWGGWLIWRHPKIKPAIDGRMHLWRDNTGYSAFDEYYPLEQNIKDIDRSRFDAAYVWRGKAIYQRLLTLTQEGKWRMIYLDSRAAVFVRTGSRKNLLDKYGK